MSDRTVWPPLLDVAPTVTAPLDRHWFVPDETGDFCAACSLPRSNRRHVPRKEPRD